MSELDKSTVSRVQDDGFRHFRSQVDRVDSYFSGFMLDLWISFRSDKIVDGVFQNDYQESPVSGSAYDKLLSARMKFYVGLGGHDLYTREYLGDVSRIMVHIFLDFVHPPTAQLMSASLYHWFVLELAVLWMKGASLPRLIELLDSLCKGYLEKRNKKRWKTTLRLRDGIGFDTESVNNILDYRESMGLGSQWRV